MSAESLVLRGIKKRWDHVVALDGVDLEFAARRYTCVMGPSGAGKSTLLRILAGLEAPDRGDVLLGTRRLTEVAAENRPFHTVFQDVALFPHMNVRENVAFAGRVSGHAASELHARADHLLEEVGLDPGDFGVRHPDTLSGGERQRVALARSLFDTPAFLLLDEPLSALDRSRRGALRRRLVELQRSHRVGFVHVTHDPEEAMAVADELVVLVDGRVVANGPPNVVYRRPPSLTVASLLGEVTELHAGWIRPDDVGVRADASGRLAVTEVGRAPLGSAWELTLQGRDHEFLAHVRNPPDGAVESVDWDDESLLKFED